jgi:hypothetical protein
MDDYESLKHTKWECKYHVVFIPECRRQKPYRQLRQHLGELFRRLDQQRRRRGEGFPEMPLIHLVLPILLRARRRFPGRGRETLRPAGHPLIQLHGSAGPPAGIIPFIPLTVV